MKIVIDTDSQTLEVDDHRGRRTMALYSDEAFMHLSRQWVRVGWNQKYQYGFSWLGRPIIQLPEDMVRAQEVIHRLQPDVIVETGVAHGGSLVFYASLCKVLGKGRVIGIDLEIRPHNRRAIETHPLSHLITLVEGDSVAAETLAKVKALIGSGESAIVFLDSNHSRAHVAAELEAYADLVPKDHYVVATDGIMEDLSDVPRGVDQWVKDNPCVAAREFVVRHPEFVLEQPLWPFNESTLSTNVTHWPGAWLRRR